MLGAILLACAACGSDTPERELTASGGDVGVDGGGGNTSPTPPGVEPSDAAAGVEGSAARDASSDVSSDAGADVAAEAGGSPSGQPMPVGDLAGWRLIFADDFTTDVALGSFPSAVASKWSAYDDGWKDTSKNGTYQPSKVLSVAAGLLDMHLHTENGVHMVAAPQPILPGGSPGLAYGRYVVRFRSDAISGYKTAWLLWPDSEAWPKDGEIDFPEGDLDGTMGAFMHRQNGANGGDQDGYSSKVTYTSWHTADLVWTATSCSFTIDGVTLGTSKARIPDTPMHYVLQTETQLSGGPPPDASQGHVQIDWIVVYAPK